MTTMVCSRPRVNGNGGVTVLSQEGNGLRVRIRTSRYAATYRLSGVEADYGRGFLIEKDGGESYYVNIDGDRSECPCLGSLRHGYCRHVDAIRALIRCGRI